MKKKIILTFDYELFFGNKSGTPERCLLEPTDKLLATFNKYSIKGTFFIDVLYYMRLLESQVTIGMAQKIKEQLQAIVAQGSRIELHLHPHWLDAEYVEGEWMFPSYKKYRLQSLTEEEISKLFSTGTQILEEIARQVIPEYKVMAFRAGGFCIQPFNFLKQGFLNNNIIVDSSVAPGLFEENDSRKYDFRLAPDLSCYTFSDNPNEFNRGGHFIELPISTYKVNLVSKCLAKVIKMFQGKPVVHAGDGVGIPLRRAWWNKFLSEVRMITLDGHICPDEFIRQINASKRDIVTVIAHPKSLSSFSFECIDRLAKTGYSFVDIKHVCEFRHDVLK